MPSIYTYLNAPVRINFLLRRGDFPAMRKYSTFIRTVHFEDKDKNPINLNGWFCETTIRASYDDEPKLVLTTHNGGMILDDRGMVKWYATDDQTGAIEIIPDRPNRFPRSQRHIYDTKLVAPDGLTLTFAEGYVDIVDSVTR